MFLRKIAVSLVCLLSASTTFAQPGTDYLIHLSGANSGSGRLLAYLANDNDLLSEADTTGPLNARIVVALPSGQGFYLVGDGPLQFLNPNLQNFLTLNGVQGPISHVRLTPDGKFLFVFGQDVYIVNTATNTVVATDLGVQSTPMDVTFTPDSKKAWLLQESPGAGLITPINLLTLTAGTAVNINRAGLSITLSPKGRLYVASTNQIDEYKSDPIEYQDSIFMNAKPGPLHFTADGSRAYFVNQTPEIVGYYVLYLRTKERDVNGWRQLFDPPVFEDVMIGNADRLYGFDKAKKKLYQLDVSTLQSSIFDIQGVLNGNRILAAAMSQEQPSARFLYVIQESDTQPAFRRIDLASNTIQAESLAASTSGRLYFAPIPPQTGASQFIKINDNQVVPGGGVATPIAATVLDALGRPVFNQAVTFTATNGGISIALPNGVTNNKGYVETGVAVPLLPGAYVVTLTAASASTEFSLLVPGSGGGLPGEDQLISIVRGDGQLMREQSTTPFYAPLRVKIVDADGDPRSGVPVTFTVTSGFGSLSSPFAITGEDGTASTLFTASGISPQLGFVIHAIRAESEVGSVEFREIVFKLNADSSGEPAFSNPAAVPPLPITQWPTHVVVGRGDLIPNFFQVQIKSRSLLQLNAPIPDVKLRFANEADESLDGPGACVNDTRSDQNGVARCDLKLSCDLENDTFIRMMVGERIGIKMLLDVSGGTSQNLTYISGNNQSGISGQVLPGLLTARIVDNCGGGVAGKDVVWTVMSGSATLSQVVSKSSADGTISARVTLGPTPGPVQVRVAMVNADPVIFDLSNNVVISGVQVVSGSGQTVLANQAFPDPIVFVVRDNLSNPVAAGYVVTFTTTGSVTLNLSQATTNALGRVTVNATAGPLAGAASVRATHQGFSATALLTVGSPPPPALPITAASFFNTASFNTTNRAEGMTPCGLVTVTGAGLAPTLNGVLSNVTPFTPMPFELGGIRIFVNNVAAPLQAVSNQNGVQQVNFQAPCETPLGTVTVILRINGFDTVVNNVKVFAGQPGIFSYTWSNNKNYGAVIRLKDSSYVLPTNPAVTGEDYILVLTGLGQTTPPAFTNSPGTNQPIALQAIVGVDDAGVPTQVGRYLTGSIGVYYIQFTLPRHPTAATGAVIKNDVNLAVFLVVNGQVIFGNPTLLPSIVQGPPAP